MNYLTTDDLNFVSKKIIKLLSSGKDSAIEDIKESSTGCSSNPILLRRFQTGGGVENQQGCKFFLRGEWMKP